MATETEPQQDQAAATRLTRDVLLDLLRDEGVRHVFGNPGSTELPLMDALIDAGDIEYVLALQEATAVGMADGYAQATGRPAFLNLHTSAGLGNAIGNLTNAQANATPLVVTAGQQDRRQLERDPLLAGDLVGLAAPVSKWTHEIRGPRELGTYLRRAFNDAAAAPAGPVFVSIPVDVLEEPFDEPPPPRSTVSLEAVPTRLDELADLAVEAGDRLALVLGDEVAAAGGVDAARELAEALGCPAFGAPLHSNVVFPVDHPLWRGQLGYSAELVRGQLQDFDRVLLVGGKPFMAYPYSDGAPLPEGVELLHVSPDPAQLGRSVPARLALLGHPRVTMEALAPLVRQRVDADRARGALGQAAQARQAVEDQLEQLAQGAYDQQPASAAAAMHNLFAALPDGTPVVDEAITTSLQVCSYYRPGRPGTYFFCRGGGLGWGMPAALGVSLGRDKAPTLCVVGDGSAMYSP